MNHFITKLLNGQDETTINAIETLISSLSTKGVKKLDDRINDEYRKLSKLPKPQRPKAITKIIEEIGAVYSKDTEECKGSHSDNPYINTRKKRVYQISLKTGEVVAEHESVQAASRAVVAASEGRIKRADSSICYCCRGEKGFKTAYGFAWSYEMPQKQQD